MCTCSYLCWPNIPYVVCMQMYEDFQPYIHTYIIMSLCILICIPVAHSWLQASASYSGYTKEPTWCEQCTNWRKDILPRLQQRRQEVLRIEHRVVPPGTPVGVSVQRSSQYTCPICTQPIVEETDSIQGQEAILCEGTCVVTGTTIGAQV